MSTSKVYDQKNAPVEKCRSSLNPSFSDLERLEHIVLNLKGSEWQKLAVNEREDLVEICFQYWRSRGFPYSCPSDAEIVREYAQLSSVTHGQILQDDKIQMSMVGVRLANYFHPQMWAVVMKGRRSPYKCFYDDKALRRLIRRAFNIWPDRYSLNASNLRAMLRTFSRTGRVSNFRPTAAKAIYERYSSDGDRVLDFSSGYGGRMLGCLPLARHYIGIDPCHEQIIGLHNMNTKLKTLVKLKARTRIHQGCAEDILPKLGANSISLVFSSPPYFNTERYSDDPTQSYLKFPTYSDWMEAFIGKIMSESHRILKPKGYLILNVADISGYNLTDDVMCLAKKFFKLTETLKLQLGNLPYLRSHAGEAYKYEPVFIFKKDG